MTAERESYLFSMREAADGKPAIVREPIRGHLPVLGHGRLTLELTDGTTVNEASELGRSLNSAVLAVSYTA